MIITLTVSSTKPLELKTDNDLPHEKSSVELKGSDRDIDFIKSVGSARSLTGHDGHKVSLSYITNVDLIAAVYAIPEVKVLSISPPIRPDPLPPDAIP
jgi:hypothetical protein